MVGSGGLIIEPVSIYDIQQVLGTFDHEAHQLCTKHNINQWAKYKPIKVATLKETVTPAQRVNANYGIIDIPTWTRLDYMSEFLFSSDRTQVASPRWPLCDIQRGSLSKEYFGYQKPTGGAASPYRIHDFGGYFHMAQAPLGEITTYDIKISPIGELRLEFNMGSESDYTLKLGELTLPGTPTSSIGNMYFGVLMKKSGGATYAVTQKGETDITVSQMQTYRPWVVIPSSVVTASFAGTWNVYPIISQQPIPATTDISNYRSGYFIAILPYHSKNVTISIQYAQIAIINAVGYRVMSSQQKYVNVTLTLRNDEGVDRNYRASVQLYNNRGEIQEASQSATGKVLANSTSDVTLSVYVADIWNSLERGYFTAECNISASAEPNVKFKTTSTWGLTMLTDDLPRE